MELLLLLTTSYTLFYRHQPINIRKQTSKNLSEILYICHHKSSIVIRRKTNLENVVFCYSAFFEASYYSFSYWRIYIDAGYRWYQVQKFLFCWARLKWNIRKCVLTLKMTLQLFLEKSVSMQCAWSGHYILPLTRWGDINTLYSEVSGEGDN